MGERVVKRAYRYRFYPSDQQAQELNRTFGCVRKVYNLALEARTAAWYGEQRRVTYVQSSAMLTAWKRSPELTFLSEVAASGRSTHSSSPSAAPGRRRSTPGQRSATVTAR
jgi:putative transposase